MKTTTTYVTRIHKLSEICKIYDVLRWTDNGGVRDKEEPEESFKKISVNNS